MGTIYTGFSKREVGEKREEREKTERLFSCVHRRQESKTSLREEFGNGSLRRAGTGHGEVEGDGGIVVLTLTGLRSLECQHISSAPLLTMPAGEEVRIG